MGYVTTNTNQPSKIPLHRLNFVMFFLKKVTKLWYCIQA